MGHCSSFPRHQQSTTEVAPFSLAACLAVVAVVAATLKLSGCGCIGGGSSFGNGSVAVITVGSLSCVIPALPVAATSSALGTAFPTQVAFVSR